MSSAASRLWRYARRHRRTFALASAASIVNRIFDLAPPFLIGMAVDIVVRREGSAIASWFGITGLRDQLIALGAINAVVWGAESAFQYLYARLWRGLAQRVQHDARMDAWQRLLSLELSFFEERSSGALMAVLNDDVNQLERFLDRGINDLLQTATTVLVIGGTFLVMAPEVAPFAFLPVPLILWGSFRFQRRLEPRYDEVRAKAGALNASLSNDLGGMATIFAFASEKREAERIEGASLDYQEANGRAIAVSSAFVPLIRMAILVGFTATLIIGGWMTLEGRLEVGSYSVMVYITQRLLWPLTRLGETFDLYQRAMASARRLLDLLDAKPALLPGQRTLEKPQGIVRFDDVHFAYGDGAEVLRGVSLDIQAGETHAVVGATGSGKSTLVKLLLRLYDPTSGSLCLDGVALPELRFEELRGAMGLVAQDVFLFHGTVRENVAYGRPAASDELLWQALEAAEAAEFVRSLPEGLETMVGERGQKLSGGQRQRLSLARALVRDPAVLILDEATSAVDNETEAAIQRSLAAVTAERTTLIVAHRLSTIVGADCIHVMEKGRIVERGTHAQLLESDGLYARLWKVQTGGGAELLPG